METVNATSNIRLTGPGIHVGIEIHRRTQKSSHASWHIPIVGWHIPMVGWHIPMVGWHIPMVGWHIPKVGWHIPMVG